MEKFEIDINQQQAQIDKLISYVDIFTQDDFTPYQKIKVEDGEFEVYSEEVDSFIQLFYKSKLLVNFRWQDWQKEALKFFENPLLVNEASEEEVLKLLTQHIRKDRFFDGHLGEMIETKHISQILERPKILSTQAK